MGARLLPPSRPKINLAGRSRAWLRTCSQVTLSNCFAVVFLLSNHMSKHLLSLSKPRSAPRYICGSCRAKLLSAEPNSQPVQQRWITRNHIRRIKIAEEGWAERADMIAAGRKQSMLNLLEERGYVNQIVGCAWLPFEADDQADILTAAEKTLTTS